MTVLIELSYRNDLDICRSKPKQPLTPEQLKENEEKIAEIYRKVKGLGKKSAGLIYELNWLELGDKK